MSELNLEAGQRWRKGDIVRRIEQVVIFKNDVYDYDPSCDYVEYHVMGTGNTNRCRINTFWHWIRPTGKGKTLPGATLEQL
jgi:hypothetical protein